jgi:major vault protein
MSSNVVRVKPLHYIHVLDTNTNVTRVLTGPRTYTREEHEIVSLEPTRMIMIAPRSYCRISNPAVRDKDGGEVQLDDNGIVQLRHGDMEMRFEQEPFPLYPGEALLGKVEPLEVVEANVALHLKAVRDFHDDVAGCDRGAGDEWLFCGPATYIPRVEVERLSEVKATIVRENVALKLLALREMVDAGSVARKAGEEWLHRTTGAYLPGVNERIVQKVAATVLTEKKALHLRATRTFVDVFGRERKAGEEWLVTIDDAETHIPDVYEEKVREVQAVTLTNRQYCTVLDPVGDDGKPQLGRREVRAGEATFFLQPGERLERGLEDVYVLGEDEALLLRARAAFKDRDSVARVAGTRWMIGGPCDYVPHACVEVVERRQSIPLDENEGIYVRDNNTGAVRMVHGEAYMLLPHESLWEKVLPEAVEDLLRKGVIRDAPGRAAAQFSESRDRTRVVTYRAPHNSAVQVHDYKAQKTRVVFGPELVMLGPDEHFTMLSLSGGRPKISDQIPSLTLLLGPDFMTDQIVVETSDHARLRLQLAYNWHFEVDKDNADDAAKIFAVPDFVGDCCKAIASRVRGAVAQINFERFHQNAAAILSDAVFGSGGAAKSGDDVKKDDDNDDESSSGGAAASSSQARPNRLIFSANNLVVSNIDIQEVEPVDPRTRESLQQSVQVAIEIATKSQEAKARRDAERKEQMARGQLERQMIVAETEAEDARKGLIELKAKALEIQHAGEATAQANANAASVKIKATAAVRQAELSAETLKITAAAELQDLVLKHTATAEQQSAIVDMEVDRAERLATIEADKFREIVEAIGPDTIKQIARAGPELQAKLLGGLGLKSLVISDGNNPISFLKTARGLLSTPADSAQIDEHNQFERSFNLTGLDSDVDD